MSCIVFTGGGTAGHYAPNYAIIPLIKNDFDEIVYIGSKNGAEKLAAEKRGVKYYGVTTAKLVRSLTPKNALIPFKLLKGISEAKKILKELSPSVVFSKGGYVALPTVLAAHALGVPIISHESDLSVGLANKIAAKYSKSVLTSFKETAEKLPNAHYAGTPLREELFKPRDKAAIKKKFGFDENKKVLLITGGSQGSGAINETVKKSVYGLVNEYNVLHLCGKGKAADIKAEGYRQIEFAEDMGEVYAVADTALSRAGANTLFELIALKIPTLAVPLPKGNSRGDQIENALYFKDNGLIAVLMEENLTPETLISALKDLEKNRGKITSACGATNYRQSAKKIANYIKSYK